MDKNIAAILREDARTVWVTFGMTTEPDVPFAVLSDMSDEEMQRLLGG